jgi:DNA repair photolyase
MGRSKSEDPPERPAPGPTLFGDGFVSVGELGGRRPTGGGGLAARARCGEGLDLRNEVEYRALPTRSLVARCESPRVPFEFTINPYRGCEFGCTYCYARYTHEFLELDDPFDFERKVMVKQGAADALRTDLRRLRLEGKHLAIGSATDPYQPAERRFGLTRSILEVLASRRDLRLSITTKSDLVLRDLDLLRTISSRSGLHVNITITTLDGALARKTEPRAPRPDLRLSAVRALTDAGIRAGVFVMPVLPGITDAPHDLRALVHAAAEHRAAYLSAQVLFLRQCSRARYEPFLQAEFPQLIGRYRQLYFSGWTSALEAYSRLKAAEIRQYKREAGLSSFAADSDLPHPAPTQLSLDL